MDRSVEPLMRGWLGIVRGVIETSSFSRTIAMCSFSRTILNPRISKVFDHTLFWRIPGEPRHSENLRLCHECFQYAFLFIDRFRSECFNVESNGGANVLQGFVIGVALANHDTLQSNWVRNVTILVLFDDDLDCRSFAHCVTSINPSVS